MTIVPKKAEPFHKLMGSQLKHMYNLKLLDAPAYVLLIVQTQRAIGWKWTFRVKDFCAEWGISKSAFYRAVSKLKTLGVLNWEADGLITVWHGTDIAQEDSPTSGNLVPIVGQVEVPEVGESVPEVGKIFPDMRKSVPLVGTKKPETHAEKEFQTPHSIHISSESTDSEEESSILEQMQPLEEVAEEGEKHHQEAIAKIEALRKKISKPAWL